MNPNVASENQYDFVEKMRKHVTYNYAKVISLDVVARYYVILHVISIQCTHPNTGFQVNIFLRSMDEDSIVEEPKYNLSSFLVELGGALSLFLGSSLVSVFEYVEFIVRIIIAIFLNIYQLKAKLEWPFRLFCDPHFLLCLMNLDRLNQTHMKIFVKNKMYNYFH